MHPFCRSFLFFIVLLGLYSQLNAFNTRLTKTNQQISKTRHNMNMLSDSFTSLYVSTSSQLDAINTVKYDAQLPSLDILYGFGGVTAVLAITTVYWWTVVIPQQRTNLAISKSRGQVNQLLTSLEESKDTEDDNNNKAFQRWLFSDWLTQRIKRTPKPAAIPFLKKAKWNSGDNPVLVTFAGMMAVLIASSLSERVFAH